MSHLGGLDVRLWLDGERLRYSAPAGVLTPDLLAQVAECKQEICTLLRTEQRAVVDTDVLLPLARNGKLPLSFSQQRLWIIEQLTPANAAYHIPCAIRLSGQLNYAALTQAVAEIIRRHEILRTTFKVVDEKPVQVVSPPSETTLPLIDLEGLDRETQERCTRMLGAQYILTPFDL